MVPQKDSPRETLGMLNAYGRFASLGIQLTASMCLVGLGGYWLDGKLGTYPWLMIVGLMAGAAAGFYSLIRTVNSTFSPRPPSDDSTE